MGKGSASSRYGNLRKTRCPQFDSTHQDGTKESFVGAVGDQDFLLSVDGVRALKKVRVNLGQGVDQTGMTLKRTPIFNWMKKSNDGIEWHGLLDNNSTISFMKKTLLVTENIFGLGKMQLAFSWSIATI